MSTIQGELERALGKLVGEIHLTAASRTDAGVHAKGQVVSFRTTKILPSEVWIKALNFYLPQDIAVKAAYEVDDNFNVRRDALSREYYYWILNGPCRSPLWRRFTFFVPKVLDIEAMNDACHLIVGEHDFAPFSPGGGEGTVRTIYKAEVYAENDLATFSVVANSFLPHQVRHTIGSLIRVGLGKMDIDTFGKLVSSGQRGIMGPAAPARGLYLAKVNYPNFPPKRNENLYS